MTAPARAAAYVVLRRASEQGAWADRALHAAARGLDTRERGQAMRLCYGTIQRRATLDHLLEAVCDRRLETLEPPLLAALRLGAYELCFAASAPYAVVSDAVELAGPGAGRGLVNAVLRRLAREREQLLGALHDEDPRAAAVRHSMPLWIVQAWWAQLGADATRALLARLAEPAEHAVRANTLRIDAATLAAQLGPGASAVGEPPEAIVLDGPFDVHGSQAWREGLLIAQSRAAMLAAHALAPRPGERVLDLCAAPGGKTTHLAALMAGRGEIVAVERHAGRAAALAASVERLGVSAIVKIVIADGAAPASWGVPGRFDRVLLDAPCSGLGTLHSRPDLRWHASPQRMRALVGEQSRLLAAAVAALAPGGTLVYSTCTIGADENERQMRALLDADPRLRELDLQQRFPAWANPHAACSLLALPHVQGSDGFYIAAARLQR